MPSLNQTYKQIPAIEDRGIFNSTSTSRCQSPRISSQLSIGYALRVLLALAWLELGFDFQMLMRYGGYGAMRACLISDSWSTLEAPPATVGGRHKKYE
jgi:hypothetical protein